MLLQLVFIDLVIVYYSIFGLINSECTVTEKHPLQTGNVIFCQTAWPAFCFFDPGKAIVDLS